MTFSDGKVNSKCRQVFKESFVDNQRDEFFRSKMSPGWPEPASPPPPPPPTSPPPPPW